jgi:hypothetical protein
MKLFRDLLLENPDTVYYKRKTYSYTSPANRCAFLVYKDEKSGKNVIFGYSVVKKDFVCDDSDVLKELKELENSKDVKYDSNNRDQLDYWAQQGIKNLKNGNNGGGHLQLENILKGMGRFGAYADPLLKGRIFEVDDAKDVVDDSDLKIESTIPSGKAIIVTFWDARREKIIKYKDQYEKVIEFNGYDPKDCLYEPSLKFYTYTEFYTNEEPKSIESKPVPEAPKPNLSRPDQKMPVTINPEKKSIPKNLQETPDLKPRQIPDKSKDKYNKRNYEVIKTIEVTGALIKVDIYDNGQIDGDTVSIFLNEKLLVPPKMLTANPISLSINLSEEDDTYDLIMFAESLGSIPPNTAFMIITTSTSRYEINISSTEQTSGAIRFKVKR